MAPTAHLLISWLTTVEILKQRRERICVSIAGVAPDLDGAGYIIDKLASLNGEATNYYFSYHHVTGHNIFAALTISALATFLAKAQRLAVFLLSQTCIYLHLLCDLIGTKGPDGYQWPLYVLYPFDKVTQVTWSGQWEMNAWQNMVIAAFLVLLCVVVSVKRKITPLELFSHKLDQEVFRMYKKYFSRAV